MSFLIDEAFLPATLTARPMTDEQFAEFCSEHPDLFFEMSAEAELIVMPPPYSLTGVRQGKVFAQLNQWAETDGSGLAGEATTAFVLPWRAAISGCRVDFEGAHSCTRSADDRTLLAPLPGFRD